VLCQVLFPRGWSWLASLTTVAVRAGVGPGCGCLGVRTLGSRASSHRDASLRVSKVGESMGGMPSRGGPPPPGSGER
jgi:hypothetical protein